MDSEAVESTDMPPEINCLSDKCDTSVDETALIAEFENISFPSDSAEDLFTIINIQENEGSSTSESIPSQPTTPFNTRLIRGDLKVAAKYQWGYSNKDGNDTISSYDTDDEEFDKLLQFNLNKPNNNSFVEIDIGEEVKKPKTVKNVLDKDYYKLPEYEAFPLNWSEKCTIEPFGKVFQHCDALDKYCS
uniref:Uncharacterized protein n=1 Tax=Panagrolaimus davidi TaxID=227884 RepID=A0A914QUW5_9BILA